MFLFVEATDARIFEDAEEFGLGGGGHVADFVEEEGAVLGEFEAAGAAFDGTGEGAFFVAEEFAFDERFRHGGAIEGDEGAAGAGAEGVHGPGDEFLAGAAFAGDEDGGFAGGDLFDEGEDLAHGSGLAGHVAEGAVAGELALETLGFFGEAAVGDGAVQKNAEHGGLDGFFEEPVGTEVVDGGEGGFDVAEGGKDDGGDLNAFAGEAAEEFKAVHAGHFEIGDEDGDGVGEELFESFLAIGGGVGGKAPTADDGGEAGALGFFVVSDEDAGDGKRRGDGHKSADSVARGLPL